MRSVNPASRSRAGRLSDYGASGRRQNIGSTLGITWPRRHSRCDPYDNCATGYMGVAFQACDASVSRSTTMEMKPALGQSWSRSTAHARSRCAKASSSEWRPVHGRRLSSHQSNTIIHDKKERSRLD